MFMRMVRTSARRPYAVRKMAVATLVEPNHLRRCLDLLEGLPRLDNEDALDAWLERIEDDGSDLAEPAGRLLLTEFLDGGYEDVA